MNRTPVSSSHLVSIGYEPISQTLEVEFRGGTVYQYFGVPADVHRWLVAASARGESVGKYFDLHVKKADYRYTPI